ncbi:hypothetical protein PoB_005114100 [Plakobranchus ocellatus]|uniref:Uncharacterized protein n=1 Tax=Plakobranchus ocellatus TaxID=259542 RepID=A0AAV4BVT7_9GAST|nr:hypothetical protein PoB_005114100 [Plakobranchus ocellatus]
MILQGRSGTSRSRSSNSSSSSSSSSLVWFSCLASPHRGDLRLSGLPSGQGADGGARVRDRSVPAYLRADSISTVPPTPFNPGGTMKLIVVSNDDVDYTPPKPKKSEQHKYWVQPGLLTSQSERGIRGKRMLTKRKNRLNLG